MWSPSACATSAQEPQRPPESRSVASTLPSEKNVVRADASAEPAGAMPIAATLAGLRTSATGHKGARRAPERNGPPPATPYSTTCAPSERNSEAPPPPSAKRGAPAALREAAPEPPLLKGSAAEGGALLSVGQTWCSNAPAALRTSKCTSQDSPAHCAAMSKISPGTSQGTAAVDQGAPPAVGGSSSKAKKLFATKHRPPLPHASACGLKRTLGHCTSASASATWTAGSNSSAMGSRASWKRRRRASGATTPSSTWPHRTSHTAHAEVASQAAATIKFPKYNK
mmetsp:Transcript_44233/g.127847  ORF Transcript_44233/g.127847 Transcript_44233/m.127847 type:complete len:283 (-) Transcript_44233:1374-2222(-)